MLKPYYQTKNGVLYHGDCLDVMPELEPVDLILTDPPYGTTACKWDSVIPFEPMWKRINSLISDRIPVVLFGSEPFSSALRMSNIKNYKYDWIWKKSSKVGFQNANRRPLKNNELISIFNSKIYFPQGLIFYGKTNRRTSVGEVNSYVNISQEYTQKYTQEYTQKYTNYPTTIIEFKTENGLHPTQKPVPLFEYLIKTYTNEGNTVLDFCAGSGTTAIAAENTNRKWILIEKEEEYCEIAAKRIEKYAKRIKPFGLKHKVSHGQVNIR